VIFADPIAWERTLPIRPSSQGWCATVKAFWGSQLESDERKLFLELSGGVEPQPGGWTELLAVAGRRGGKSETIARVGVFEALHGGHGVALAPGQLGLVAVIAPLREQAQEIMGYARGLAGLPQVKRQLAGEPTRDEIRFKTGIAFKVMTADAVAVSGPTVVCAIRDELAKFPGDDAAVPDREIDNSLRPALAPIVGAPPRRLIGITSAYIKEGIAFETDRDHYGRHDAPLLVVRGTTEQFNPNVDRAWLAKERARVGERVFAREYLAEWVEAITEGWFGDTVDASIDTNRVENPPRDGVYYFAGLDAAFRGDKFALAIAHRERWQDGRTRTVVDLVKAWQAPSGGILSVPLVVGEAASLIQQYRAYAVADQFAVDPLKELFSQRGVYLTERPWTPTTKPQRFARVRGRMTDGLVRLPNHPALIREFHSIRGKLLRLGGEQIEARIGSDDLVHATVLAVSEAIEREPDFGEPKRKDPEPGTPEYLEWEREQRRIGYRRMQGRSGIDAALDRACGEYGDDW
jgi:hypothetical protein